MNKNKKITIISLILILVSVIIFFVFLRPRKEKTEIITPKTVSISNRYEGDIIFNLEISKEDFTFPKQLPYLERIITPFSENYMRKVANNLKFEGEPYIAEDVFDGTTYYWTNDNYGLFIFPKSQKITFSKTVFAKRINKQLTENEISDLAINYLVNNLEIKNELSTLKISYLNEDTVTEGFRETEKENAIAIKVDLYPSSSSGYSILSTYSKDPAINIQMTMDGDVFSFEYIDFSNLSPGLTEYPIIGYEEISNNIQNAILTDIRGEQLALIDLAKDSIESVTINEIEISYLLEKSNSNLLQPIYKLSGPAKVTGFVRELEAIFYLPAYAN